jgi:hypothetical protein
MTLPLADSRREAVCIAASIGLVVGGMLLTGVLPDDWLSQLFAGATIIAGFALAFVCLSDR